MINGLQILQGNCLDVLKTLESESVQCCVTSPPYFGLRDYGTASWSGGDLNCLHRVRDARQTDAGQSGQKQKTNLASVNIYSGDCICGAVRVDHQIGLETTPQDFLERIVEVFTEVHRVLKNDGTLWLNIGDSYLQQKGKGFNANARLPERDRTISLRKPFGQKNLTGIPWRVAFALQEAGWILRQDIIWHKPNPMPESVGDRCTKAHEYIFLLTKSKNYYFDNEAIKEPVSKNSLQRVGANGKAVKFGGDKYGNDTSAFSPTKSGKEWNPKKERDRSLRRNRNGVTGSLDNCAHKNLQSNGQVNHSFHESGSHGKTDAQYLTRNKRSVWTIPVHGYPDAHFATFPPNLIEPCILAGSRIGDTILDPFFGAGTTALVSLKHGRECVGIELNPDYIEIAKRRLENIQTNLSFGEKDDESNTK